MWLLAVIARNLSPTSRRLFLSQMNCPPKSNARPRVNSLRAQLELEEIIKTSVVPASGERSSWWLAQRALS